MVARRRTGHRRLVVVLLVLVVVVATLVVVVGVDLHLEALAPGLEEDVPARDGHFELDQGRHLVLPGDELGAIAVRDARAATEGDDAHVGEMRDDRAEVRHLRDGVVAEGRVIRAGDARVVEQVLELVLADLVAHADDRDDDLREGTRRHGGLHLPGVRDDLAVVVELAVRDDGHQRLLDVVPRGDALAHVRHEVPQRGQQEGPATEVALRRPGEGHRRGVGRRHLLLGEPIDLTAVARGPVGREELPVGVHLGQVREDRLHGGVDLVGRGAQDAGDDAVVAVLVLERARPVNVEPAQQALDGGDGQDALDAGHPVGDVAVHVDERRLRGVLVGSVGHGKGLLLGMDALMRSNG